MKILYLASKSMARRQLLSDANIPFVILEQDADESACDWSVSLEEVARSIAEHKMNHAHIPADCKAHEVYVLTADTVIQDCDGVLYAKPENCAQAKTMLRTFSRGTILVATAYVIEKRIKRDNVWLVLATEKGVAVSSITMNMNDYWIEQYVAHVPDYCSIAGALQVEGYGAQFIEKIDGSYSGTLGLPLCQVRQALEKLKFFESGLYVHSA